MIRSEVMLKMTVDRPTLVSMETLSMPQKKVLF